MLVPMGIVREYLKQWIAGDEPQDTILLDFVVGCAAGYPGFLPADGQWAWTGAGKPPRFLQSFQIAEKLVPVDCTIEIRRDTHQRYSAVVRSNLEDQDPTPALGRSAAAALALGALRARSRARWEGRPVFQQQ